MARTNGNRGRRSLQALRAAEAAVRDLEANELRLLGAGREAFGVTGRFEYGPLGEALRVSRLRVGPAFVIGAVSAVGPVGLSAWAMLDSRISTTLGVSGLALILAVVELIAAAAAGLGALVYSGRASRARLVAAGGACGALSLYAASLASGAWTLVGAAAVAGTGFGLVAVGAYPLLVDTYRPEVRVRMLCLHASVTTVAMAMSLAIMSLGTAQGPLTWRAALLILAAAASAASAAAMWLEDVHPARWDGARLTGLVCQDAGGLGTETAELSAADVAVSVFEKLRRVVVAPSARETVTLAGLAGLWLFLVPSYGPTLLRVRFGMPDRPAAATLAAVLLGGLVGLGWFARRGEVAFRASPGRMLHLTGWAASVAGVALACAAVSPSLGIAAGCLVVAAAGFAVLLPATVLTLLSVVQPRYRPHASLFIGLVTVTGAVQGRELLGIIGARFGVQWVVLLAASATAGSAGGLARAIRVVDRDLNVMVEQLIEAAELQTMVSQGRHLPLLAARQVDYSYGQLQVLFGVDFTVDDGEMVALLGTNGAGKSTLLRAISGLGFPTRGTVHFRGADITHVAANHRVRLGITQVPGGRAVFGPMSVVDNLRVFGCTFGKDQRGVEAGIETSFEAFPRLAERRNQPASTLSGGEQQMLAVSKAFILQPRLLLIDELSLGLAPVIVAELLEMVRRINARGTAVVLVEQSVNIALSLVDHAYFMEKGEVRFDGAAADLIARPDLLRSVFLEGTSKGLA